MNRSIFLKVPLRYGSVAGALALVLLIILYYLGKHPLMISPFLDFRILLLGVFIFFTLKEIRDYYQGGILYFGQAMMSSLLVTLTAITLATLGLYLFGLWEKGFVIRYIESMTTYLKTFPPEDIERIGKEIYERNLAVLPATNIKLLAVTYFVQGIIISFFVSLILSVILRRHPKN